MANSRRIQRAVAAIIFLLPMLYFHEAARGTLVLLQGDGWTSNLGLRLLTAKLLAQGSSLLWNPYIFGGMPLLADLSAGTISAA